MPSASAVCFRMKAKRVPHAGILCGNGRVLSTKTRSSCPHLSYMHCWHVYRLIAHRAVKVKAFIDIYRPGIKVSIRTLTKRPTKTIGIISKQWPVSDARCCHFLHEKSQDTEFSKASNMLAIALLASIEDVCPRAFPLPITKSRPGRL